MSETTEQKPQPRKGRGLIILEKTFLFSIIILIGGFISAVMISDTVMDEMEAQFNDQLNNLYLQHQAELNQTYGAAFQAGRESVKDVFKGDFEDYGFERVNNAALLSEIEARQAKSPYVIWAKLDQTGDVVIYVPFGAKGPQFLEAIRE